MARITGTKNITPQTPGADQTISAPAGSINLVTTASGGVVLSSIENGLPATNVPRQLDVTSEANVNNPAGYIYNPADIYGSQAQRQAGSAYYAGGVGIEKDLNVGGYIYGRVAEATTSQQLIVKSTNTDQIFYPSFVKNLGVGEQLYGDDTSSFGQGLTYNPFKGVLTTDKAVVNSTDESDSSPGDNALYVKGGTHLNKNV